MIPLKVVPKEAEDHYDKIKDDLIKRIKTVIKDKSVKTNPPYLLNRKGEKFLKNLLENDAQKLKELIVATPSELKAIRRRYLKKRRYCRSSIRIKRRNFSSSYRQICNKNSSINRILYNIFIDSTYNGEITKQKKKYKKFDKWAFIKTKNLNTCPYCNRSYIYTIDDDRNVKPQIDHFYHKAKYPFFGMSYFNLIPSCQLCNETTCKGEKDVIKFNLKSPYEIQDDTFLFSYEYDFIDNESPLDSGVQVVLEKGREEGNNDVFKLEDLYKKHSDHVVELIEKSKKYNQSSRDFLKKFNIKLSDEEINRLIIGTYTNINDLHKRPLAKMYRDIAKELGLIK